MKGAAVGPRVVIHFSTANSGVCPGQTGVLKSYLAIPLITVHNGPWLVLHSEGEPVPPPKMMTFLLLSLPLSTRSKGNGVAQAYVRYSFSVSRRCLICEVYVLTCSSCYPSLGALTTVCSSYLEIGLVTFRSVGMLITSVSCLSDFVCGDGGVSFMFVLGLGIEWMSEM